VRGQKKYSSGIEEELKRRKEAGVSQNLARNWSFNLKNLKKEEEK
jgi:hypothetical protein